MKVKTLFNSLNGEHIPAEESASSGVPTPASFLCNGECDVTGDKGCDNDP